MFAQFVTFIYADDDSVSDIFIGTGSHIDVTNQEPDGNRSTILRVLEVRCSRFNQRSLLY